MAAPSPQGPSSPLQGTAGDNYGGAGQPSMPLDLPGNAAAIHDLRDRWGAGRDYLHHLLPYQQLLGSGTAAD
jgi:hypothetical protein